MRVVYAVQAQLNAVSSNPFTFPVAFAFLVGWFGAGFLNPHFDPGFGVGNLLVNGAGLLLMFAACSMSAQAVKRSDEHADKIDALHSHVTALHDKFDDVTPPLES